MRRFAALLSLVLFAVMSATGASAATPRSERGKDLKTTEIPNDAGFVAAGAVTASGEGVVRIFTDADHNKSYESLVQEFAPYGNAKVGDGIRVALGDFNGDGNEELVTASGGKTPIKEFELGSDGTVGNQMLSFGGFPKGAFVAAGDVNGDGRDELVVGSGKGASPKVVIRDDTTFSGTPSHVADTFLAYGSTFSGGVTVALGNTTNAGGKELITAPASGTATLTTTITVPKSAGKIADLDVSFAAFHSFDGDLDVKLTHLTTATSMFLFQDVGGTNEGFDIRLSDEFGTDISTASNPKLDGEIAGSFNPGGAAVLSVFDGEDASGVWKLDITDDTSGDTGTLFGWTLYSTF